MVAASVVTTILVLNYHHRMADTHEMPKWVSWIIWDTIEDLYGQCSQVQMILLQWIPWMLRMSRPGEKITRKSILMQKKIKEMDKNEVSSKSLLANVLDIDDNFCVTTIAPNVNGTHPSHIKPPLLN